MEDGRIKLYLTWKTLCFRGSHRELFAEGAYVPLEVRGQHADHVCAFTRVSGAQAVVTVAPRLWAAILAETNYRYAPEIWRDTRIDVPAVSTTWRNVLTGESIVSSSNDEMYLSELLKDSPVGLLAGDLPDLRRL
jgi:(1->4)-alpha-D-glucan 1-alpha-D-glucosylmutase